MMPTQTQDAVNWAVQQTVVIDGDVYAVKDMPPYLVSKVCEYFDANGIEYTTFDYYDLEPYL